MERSTTVPGPEGERREATPVYLFGVGFDEKLVLRAALRVGVKPGETVVLVYGVAGAGELERTRVENAIRNLREILGGIGVRVVEIPVSAMSLPEDVSRVVGYLRKAGPGKVVLSLGSGMRYLGFVLLLSGILYRDLVRGGAKLLVHVAREDGLYDVIASLDALAARLTRRELDVLCLLRGSAVRRDKAVEAGSKALGVKPPTLYRLLERLERRGLVAAEESLVKPTELGEAIAAVGCSESSLRGESRG